MEPMIKENLKAKAQTNQEKTEVVNALNSLLSNNQVYYQNLRGLHWMIEGDQFFVLHEKYEEWYTQAATNIDDVAERILTIGGKPSHTFEDYLADSDIKPVKNITSGSHGIEVVLNNNNILLNHYYQVIKAAEKAEDEGTVDLISGMISETEKRMWMLKAYLS